MLTRSPIQTAWLQWLAPSQTVVKDLQRDLVGLRIYTLGNGIQANYQRSREGTLARVVYSRASQTHNSQSNAQAALRSAADGLMKPANAASPATNTAITCPVHKPVKRFQSVSIVFFSKTTLLPT